MNHKRQEHKVAVHAQYAQILVEFVIHTRLCLKTSSAGSVPPVDREVGRREET